MTKKAVLIFLILITGGGFFWFFLKNFSKKPPQQNLLTRAASFSLKPESGVFKSGEILETAVILDTTLFKTSGVGCLIDFDPNLLEVMEINQTDIFGLFPTKKFDNKQGKIKISGISWNVSLGKPGTPFSGEETLATIKFKVKPVIKETKTKITFEFAGFGKTTDSNIMEAKTAKDVLRNVYPAEFTLLP